MNSNNAFTVDLTANTDATDEDGAVNQSSPTWVLTFVRFNVRDTLRTPLNSTAQYGPSPSLALAIRDNDPLVVENDCVSVTTGTNKGTLTPSMSATLVETDVNYLAAVNPGDFVFVNMLNWESDARRVVQAAQNGDPINGPDDGFKGLFKVQSVRKNISVDEQSGMKHVSYSIDGYGFTEFNNTIYFNQNLLASGSQDNFGLFIRRLSTDWQNLVNPNGYLFLREVVSLLITSFLGNGINTTDYSDDFKAFLPVVSVQFQVPVMVGQLMGIPNATAAKDLYSYLFGTQGYSANSNQTMAQGLNPIPQSKAKVFGPGFHFTPSPLKGQTFFSPEYWNCVTAWSIINQYTNSPLNEIYTCYRLAPDNRVYPTLVFRQIPFTTQDFETRFGVTPSVTKFLNVPRWKIDSSLVFNLDIGKDEVARVNFYQYYARTAVTDKNGAGPAQEVAAQNYVFDSGDVQRSGLRPAIVSNNFDPFTDVNVQSPIWAKIMGDATIGQHLKLNGTIEMVGVDHPICVGDNLEFEGVVFHIESVIHSCNIDPLTGIKRFRTTVKLSSGVSLFSTNDLTLYAEMVHTNGYKDRSNDYNRLDKILPGVSEEQDTTYRSTNPSPTAEEVKGQDYPFPQPTKPKTPIRN